VRSALLRHDHDRSLHNCRGSVLGIEIPTIANRMNDTVGCPDVRQQQWWLLHWSWIMTPSSKLASSFQRTCFKSLNFRADMIKQPDKQSSPSMLRKCPKGGGQLCRAWMLRCHRTLRALPTPSADHYLLQQWWDDETICRVLPRPYIIFYCSNDETICRCRLDRLVYYS